MTPGSARLVSDQINLVGAVSIDGTLNSTGDISTAGKVIDVGGNTANHKH